MIVPESMISGWTAALAAASPVEGDVVDACGAVDPMSGAVCTRPAHGDSIHRCKEQDFDFQWREMPRLLI